MLRCVTWDEGIRMRGLKVASLMAATTGGPCRGRRGSCRRRWYPSISSAPELPLGERITSGVTGLDYWRVTIVPGDTLRIDYESLNDATVGLCLLMPAVTDFTISDTNCTDQKDTDFVRGRSKRQTLHTLAVPGRYSFIVGDRYCTGGRAYVKCSETVGYLHDGVRDPSHRDCGDQTCASGQAWIDRADCWSRGRNERRRCGVATTPEREVDKHQDCEADGGRRLCKFVQGERKGPLPRSSDVPRRRKSSAVIGRLLVHCRLAAAASSPGRASRERDRSRARQERLPDDEIEPGDDDSPQSDRPLHCCRTTPPQ